MDPRHLTKVAVYVYSVPIEGGADRPEFYGDSTRHGLEELIAHEGVQVEPYILTEYEMENVQTILENHSNENGKKVRGSTIVVPTA